MTLADGWYKVSRTENYTVQEVFGGRITSNQESVEAWLALGYTFEPAVVLTQAEYDAATQHPATVPGVPAIPDEVREAIRDALVQRKHDICDALDWGISDDSNEQAQLEWERLTARYDKALEWLDKQVPP